MYTYIYIYIGVRGVCPNGVFFSCMRCGGGSGAEPASVRASVRVWPAGRRLPPSHIQTVKRSKPFKINGLGHFLGPICIRFFYTNLKKYAPM